MKKKQRKKSAALKWLLMPVAAVLVLVIFAGALDSMSTGRQEENKRQLEEALRRGCAACYAVEGRYPPSVEYLKDHYGIQVDEKHYSVAYDVFAANLMPDITVLECEP